MGLGGREKYIQDQWDYFRADLRAKDDEGWTDMELVGVDDDGDFCCIKVHRAVVLRSVVSPLDLDCLTVVFPDTSVTVLQAIVSLFYEGIVITSQHITSEFLATIKNLGIDPDQFSKKFIIISEPNQKKEVSKMSGSLEDGLNGIQRMRMVWGTRVDGNEGPVSS